MSTSKSYTYKWAVDTYLDQYDPTTGALQSHSHDGLVATTQSSVAYGDNIPDWRTKIRLGLDATTTLSGFNRSRGTIGYGTYVMTTLSDHVRYVYYGNLLARFKLQWIDASSSIDASADNKARSKLLSRYINLTNTFRGGNFLAEIRETIHMVRHPLQSFYHRTYEFAGTVGKLRRVYRQKPLDFTKAMADAWLAFSFGAKPLVADCNDAVRALEKLGSTGHDSVTISGHGRNDSHQSSLEIGANFITGDPGNASCHDYNLVVHNNVRYKIGLKSRPYSPRTDAQLMGVDVFDVIPAVWEAIPWSFFIDYFVNVGEVLDSMRLWDCDFKWGVRTVRNSSALTRNNVRPIPYTTGPLKASGSGGGGFWTLSTYVSRTPCGMPSPKFHFQMPGFPSMKWLNIAALTEQVRKAKG